jgi:hypothetical protein
LDRLNGTGDPPPSHPSTHFERKWAVELGHDDRDDFWIVRTALARSRILEQLQKKGENENDDNINNNNNNLFIPIKEIPWIKNLEN